MKQRIITLLLAAMLCLSLAACGEDEFSPQADARDDLDTVEAMGRGDDDQT